MKRKPKYHVGDYVVIRDHMESGDVEDGCFFPYPMKLLKGMTTRVMSCKGRRYTLEIDDGLWTWAEPWLAECRESIEEML